MARSLSVLALVRVLSAAALFSSAGFARTQAGLPYTAEEQAAILQHGPWPPAPPVAVLPSGSDRQAAVELGQALFFDTRLSPSGRVACATCHQPHQAFTDGLRRSRGVEEITRNSPTLWNAALHRWQGWDGGADSPWAQSIRALRDPREMASSASHVRTVLVQSPDLACRYRAAFGRHPAHHDAETVMVGMAQSLGAFVATLTSPRTRFDDFRDALARGDQVRMARYPAAAQRGLKLFVGKGQCQVCHAGPLFSNGEFADIGLPFFSSPGVVDSGRHGGIDLLKASPYTRLSHWAGGVDSTTTRHVEQQPRNFGEFKVPSLRLVAQTAPYMHDGQLATLADVVRHYDQMNMERLHADGEQILRPLQLTALERRDLMAFLETLSSPQVVHWRSPPVSSAACASSRATRP